MKTEPTRYRTKFPYTSSGLENGAFCTHNAPHVHTRGLVGFTNCAGVSSLIVIVNLITGHCWEKNCL